MAKNNKEVKHSAHGWTEDDKIASMKVLEQNQRNFSSTAKELGISRPTLYKWYEQFWDIYESKREYINDYVKTVSAKKLVDNGNTEIMVGKTRELYEKLLNHFLDNPGLIEKLKGHEKVQLVNVLAPYVVEKKISLGIKKGEEDHEEEKFWNSIIENMKKN